MKCQKIEGCYDRGQGCLANAQNQTIYRLVYRLQRVILIGIYANLQNCLTYFRGFHEYILSIFLAYIKLSERKRNPKTNEFTFSPAS